MENIKKQLIKLLTEDARYTYSQMAKMLGEREEVVEKAVKELESDGVIVKYSAVVNAEALNEEKVQALVEVKVALQRNVFDKYAEEICAFKEVTGLYLMSGGFDLAVFVEGKSITDIAKFISEKLSVIDGIESVQTQFILKRFKIEGQTTKPNGNGERQVIQA
ncbi:MAG: Lrp/AsnC family transcriptional regulator [Clostridia bacterium]|nr:Lrp/AsnC family transcriptional regulator [Clostridia bacterium]